LNRTLPLAQETVFLENPRQLTARDLMFRWQLRRVTGIRNIRQALASPYPVFTLHDSVRPLEFTIGN
jgi:hypothetical protein